MLRERKRKRRKFRKRMEINNESFDQSLFGAGQKKYPITQLSGLPKGFEDSGGEGRNKDNTDNEGPMLVSKFNLREKDTAAFVKVSNLSNPQSTTSTFKNKSNNSHIINNTNKQNKSVKKKKNNNSILSRRRSSLSVDLEVATIQTHVSTSFSPTSASSSQQFVYDDDFYPESHDSEDEGVFLTASNNSSSIHNSTNNIKDNVDIDIDTDHDTDLILSSPSPYSIQQDEHYQQQSTLRKGTPVPPRKNNHNSHPNPHQNVHSSMSLLSVTTNNAITIAPSRNQILEPNVFDTGGVSRHHPKRHKEGSRVHNSQHHHGRRSKTPEPNKHQPHNHLQPPFTHNFYYNPTTNITYNNRRKNNDSVCTNHSVEDNLQSVLNRLDNRIKNNFGDWSEMDDDRNFEYRNVGFGMGQHQSNNKLGHPQKKKMINPYFGGEELNSALHRHSSLDLDDLDNGPYNNSHSNNSQTSNVTLPPLIKTYHAVVRSSKGKLHDKSKKIAMSRDNNDPNSILSRAKATLNGL